MLLLASNVKFYWGKNWKNSFLEVFSFTCAGCIFPIRGGFRFPYAKYLLDFLTDHLSRTPQ